VGLICLEETIYDRVSWRDGTDPAVWVPARAELPDQPFGIPTIGGSEVSVEVENVKESAQFVLARLGLSRAP
jgi:hypothetical protein